MITWALLLAPSGCGPRRAVVEPPPGGFPALRAVMKGSLQTEARRTRFEASLALVAPDRLRVEISGPIGGTRAVLAARDGRVVVLLPPTREYADEEATPATYGALLGLPLTTQGLIDLFSRAGATASRRIPLDGGPGRGAGALDVVYEGDRIHATMGRPGDADYRLLELRVIELDRADPGSIPDDLFAPEVPAGWTRLAPGSAGRDEPSLLP